MIRDVGRRAALMLPRRSDYAGLRSTWRRDVLAGITVGVVALPLALAFGVSSGVGAAAGLATAVVAGLVAAVFGGSRVQVSGPTGAMAVVLAPVVASYGLQSVAVVTILAGLLVLIAGLTGVGRAVNFIPWPVIEGFTVGIAAIIFLQQIPAAVGQKAPDGERPLIAAWTVLGELRLPDVLPPAVVVVTVVALMLVLPRIHRAIPESLTAIAVVTVVASACALPVARIGEIPSHLPVPTLPHVDWAALQTLAGAAVAIAGLAAIESLLSARVAATLSPAGAYDPDRELAGQGLASIASGAFGGMPATGAIARTAVNVRCGARTRLAAIVHAVLLMAVIYAASAPVAMIPLSALAAVLMVTALRMVPWPTITLIVRSTRADALVFVLTAVITVCFDLIEAVEIGILVAAFFALRGLARRSGVTREPLPGPPQPGDEHIALLRLDGAFFFGAAERISAELTEHDVAVVIIRMSSLGMLDATGAYTLARVTSDLEARGITVIIKGVRNEHRALLGAVGTIGSLRDSNHLVDNLDDAVAHARSHIAREARWKS